MQPDRLRQLMVAGLVDSFGLSLGWTVFSLEAVRIGGLGTVGAYGAAMLVGVALSAPVAGWLARRLPGRTLLRGTAAVEATMRAATFALLIGGAPLAVLAVVVTVMNVVAWSGYAGMRAEVAAADRRVVAMTRYLVCIATVEAAGAAVAAVLPHGDDGTLAPALLVAVVAVYAAALLPTYRSARDARVARTTPAVSRDWSFARLAQDAAPLTGGGVVMLLASGPTLLSVGLAAELYGPASVAVSAVAFSAGALLASPAVGVVDRRALPAPVVWPLWGAGMVLGWIIAPVHLAGLLWAQFLSGVAMTALEGTMDARLAGSAEAGGATARLAQAAAARALGSAVAVGVIPLVVAAPDVGRLSLAVTVPLVLCSGLALLSGRPQRRPVVPAASWTLPIDWWVPDDAPVVAARAVR